MGIEQLPGLVKAVAELVRLIRAIQEQQGLSTDELWARAGAQLEADRAEIEAFLKAVANGPSTNPGGLGATE